uniref:Uncharacterized protein n=1 Tax=Rhizophora mucronata TaxID=61149 RepID=A0A2P2PCE9_RHIMU
MVWESSALGCPFFLGVMPLLLYSQYNGDAVFCMLIHLCHRLQYFHS